MSVRATIAAVAAGLMLSGCAVAPIVPPNLEVVALQADTGLDASYNVAARAYLQAAPTMDPALKARVKPLVLALYKATTTADTAQRLGDANTVGEQIAAATALYAQIKLLLHIN